MLNASDATSLVNSLVKESFVTPVVFHCDATLSSTPSQIVEAFLNLDNWPGFTGYGPLPGIRSAEFEVRTPEILGTRIRVINTDGSRHEEVVVAWNPDCGFSLVLQNFTPPLSKLATHFVETWEFMPGPKGTLVRRTFELHPRSTLARCALWLISFPFRLAVRKHLRLMR